MRTFFNRYEVEIRFGLLGIVLLLLLLNFSSSLAIYRLKKQITAELDNDLQSAMGHARVYMRKQETTELPDSQRRIIEDRNDIDHIAAVSLHQVSIGDSLAGRALTNDELYDLMPGIYHFLSSDNGLSRFGVCRFNPTRGRTVLIVTRIDSTTLMSVTGAARRTLVFAIATILLIIPITIALPRFILQPFRQMRNTAEAVGKFDQSIAGDEVGQVIQSYKNIVAELRENEEELRRLYAASSSRADRLERFNRYILSSIGTGVITVDLSGVVVGINAAAGGILGLDTQQVAGRHYLQSLDDFEKISLLIEAGLLRGEYHDRGEYEIRCPDNRRIWLGIESSVIVNDENKALGTTILFNDLTEIKSLQAEVALTQRMAALGEMTAGLAHQLRNSMAAINGFSQLLKKKTVDEASLHDLAVSIRDEAVTAESLVSRFLNFARPLAPSYEPVSIGSLLTECAEKYRRTTENQISIRIIGIGREEAGCLIGDPLLLKEAIGNVIGNAVEALCGEGLIAITVTSDDSFCEIAVTDDGPGIPESIAEHIFTPFFSSKPSGTGLGLALAQKIISHHGGQIAFDPNPEEGAVCRIRLPLQVENTVVEDFHSVKKG